MCKQTVRQPEADGLEQREMNQKCDQREIFPMTWLTGDTRQCAKQRVGEVVES